MEVGWTMLVLMEGQGVERGLMMLTVVVRELLDKEMTGAMERIPLKMAGLAAEVQVQLDRIVPVIMGVMEERVRLLRFQARLLPVVVVEEGVVRVLAVLWVREELVVEEMGVPQIPMGLMEL